MSAGAQLLRFSIHPVKSIAVPLLTLLLASCAGSFRVNDDQVPVASEDIDAILLEEYQIGIGDGLIISVWRNPEISAQVVVLPDGNISVPLVGDVKAAGSTTQILADTIKEALNEFIREPEVTVSVVVAASSEYLQRVRITGAVNGQLSIPFRRGMTVLDVVLLAGGLSPFANGNKAVLHRKECCGGVERYRLKLEDILAKGILDTNYPMMPSDVITVPEKRF